MLIAFNSDNQIINKKHNFYSHNLKSKLDFFQLTFEFFLIKSKLRIIYFFKSKKLSILCQLIPHNDRGTINDTSQL